MEQINNRLRELRQIIESDERFLSFYNLLNMWNEKFNLTTITQKDEVYLKHFLDSAIGADFLPDGASVLDIGCGAGFPSIPLKLLKDNLNFTLIDSSAKKIGFVSQTIATLGLTNITALHTRAEDLPHKNSFDAVVSRAVASLPILLEYSIPYLKVGKTAVFYKGSIDEEIALSKNALKTLNAEITNKIEFSLTQDGENKRCLLFVTKTAPTPNIYPRPQNKPRKNPL